MNIDAVIIGGGKASRLFGTKKHLINICGHTIFERQISILSKFFTNIFAVSNDNVFDGIKNFRDIYQNIGPLGGLHVALSKCYGDYIFAVSADMPFLSDELIRLMLEIYQKNYFDVLVPKHTRFEPLFAIYSKKLLPLVENNIRNHKYSLLDLILSSNYKILEIPPEIDANFAFFNINTPNDLKEAQIICQKFSI